MSQAERSHSIEITTQPVLPDLAASPRWVRVVYGGETIADSKQVKLLRGASRYPYPVYAFPQEDVRMDLLEQTPHQTETPKWGRTVWWTLKTGDTVVENAAWSYSNPPEGSQVENYLLFEWRKMDSWHEENEEIFVHARDPYHRVDVRESTRHVKVILAGETIADTQRPVLLFETGFSTRFYIPREDVKMDLLEPTDLKTACPYKGEASAYWSAKIGGQAYENIVWCYPNPLPECARIQNLLCFYNERVEAIYVDGELES